MIPEDPTGEQAMAEFRKCKFPITLAGLARSWQAMSQAALVIGLDRAEQGSEQTVMHVLKNRHGPTGQYQITGTHTGRWVNRPAAPQPQCPPPRLAVMVDDEIPRRIAAFFADP